MNLVNKHIIAIAGLLMMTAATVGCSDNTEPDPINDTPDADVPLLVRKPAAAKSPAPTESSTEDDIIEYLRTFNGEFETGDKIRLVNNMIGYVPDFKSTTRLFSTGNRGYFEYYCAGTDTTSDGFYRFKPSIKDHALRWPDATTAPGDANAIYTNAKYYAFNAMYYWAGAGTSGFDALGISTDFGLIYNHVLTDQSSEQKFRMCDIMQAHHLKDESEKGEVIKLKFWHQLAMVVINVSVPKETFGIGFTPQQMKNASCALTNFFIGFYLPYNLDFDSDRPMATYTIGTNNGENAVDALNMWPVGYVREGTGPSGEDQLTRTYAALVPPQTVSDKVCRFSINGKNYSYTHKGDVLIERSNMTIIDLDINPNQNDPILLDIRILPWENAYVPDFPLYPETNGNQ